MGTRNIQIYIEHPTLKVNKLKIKQLFVFLDTLKNYVIAPGELSIAILTDTAIANIHKKFMNKSCKTDVITFCGDPVTEFAGEICVSADRAQSVSIQKNIDFSNELNLYLIHGWLHLAGYDDLTAKERLFMRKAEKILLQTAINLLPKFKI